MWHMNIVRNQNKLVYWKNIWTVYFGRTYAQWHFRYDRDGTKTMWFTCIQLCFVWKWKGLFSCWYDQKCLIYLVLLPYACYLEQILLKNKCKQNSIKSKLITKKAKISVILLQNWSFCCGADYSFVAALVRSPNVLNK